MQKTCKQFIVFDAGLVVNPSFPCLGASPDGKVYDPTKKDPFGLLEIKKTLHMEKSHNGGSLQGSKLLPSYGKWKAKT